MATTNRQFRTILAPEGKIWTPFQSQSDVDEKLLPEILRPLQQLRINALFALCGRRPLAGFIETVPGQEQQTINEIVAFLLSLRAGKDPKVTVGDGAINCQAAVGLMFLPPPIHHWLPTEVIRWQSQQIGSRRSAGMCTLIWSHAATPDQPPQLIHGKAIRIQTLAKHPESDGDALALSFASPVNRYWLFKPLPAGAATQFFMRELEE